jgi:CRISPR-associated protein (TIGR03984 family)
MGDLAQWLTTLAQTHKLVYLIAHADDGVIWGKHGASGMQLSVDYFPQGQLALRATTLHTARLFAAHAEILLWRDGDEWAARIIEDRANPVETEHAASTDELPAFAAVEVIDEDYLLWGNQVEAAVSGAPFLQVSEGKQGIVHAPPISVAPEAQDAARLQVRHYLRADGSGAVRMVASRLRSVEDPKGAK